MVSRRTCKGISKGGDRCSAPPLTDGDFCFWHDPDHEAEAAEARRLGGLRPKRESTLQGAYELQCLDTVEGIRRYLEVALLDLVSNESSVQSRRAIISGVLAAAKLLEVGEQEERLQEIEAALGPRIVKPQGRDRRR